jgi:hypothetical protein
MNTDFFFKEMLSRTTDPLIKNELEKISKKPIPSPLSNNLITFYEFDNISLKAGENIKITSELQKEISEYFAFLKKLYDPNNKEIPTLSHLSKKNKEHIYENLNESEQLKLTDASGDKHLNTLTTMLKMRHDAYLKSECKDRLGEELYKKIGELEKNIDIAETVSQTKSTKELIEKIKPACSSIVWGSNTPNEYDIPVIDTKLRKYAEIVNHMETIQDGLVYGKPLKSDISSENSKDGYKYRQRVLAYFKDIKKYDQFRHYFHVVDIFQTKDVPDDEADPCNRLVDYTLQLNKMLVLCSLYSYANAVRIVLPKNRIMFHDKKLPITKEQMNELFVLGLVKIKYYDDREDYRGREKNKSLYYLLVKPREIRMEDGWHGKKGKYLFMINTDYEPLYPQGLFSKGPIAQYELRILLCTLKDRYVYRSLENYDDNEIMFVSSQKLEEKSNFSRMNIVPIKYVCMRLKKNRKRIFVVVEENPDIDEKKMTNDAFRKTIVNRYKEQFIYESHVNMDMWGKKLPHVFIIASDLLPEDIKEYDEAKHHTEVVNLIFYRDMREINKLPRVQKGGDRFVLSNIEVVSEMFTKFIDIYYQMLRENDYDLNKLAELSYYFNEYYFLQHYHMAPHVKYETQQTYDRTFLVKKYKDKNIKSIINYEYFTRGFLQSYEVLNKFQIVPTDVLEICMIPSMIESYFYYNNRKHHNNIKYTVCILTDYVTSLAKNVINATTDNLKNIIGTLDVKRFKKIKDIDKSKHKTIISSFVERNHDSHTGHVECSKSKHTRSDNHMISDYTNLLNFAQIINYTLDCLEEGGTFIMYIYQVTRYCIADMVNLLKNTFNTTNIYVSELNNPIFIGGHVVICQDYFINTEVIKKFKEIEQSIKDIDFLSINCKYDGDKLEEIKTFPNIIDFGVNEDYGWIKKFNEEYYFKKYLFLKKLHEHKDLNKKQLKLLKNDQLVNSVLWAKKYDLEIKEPYEFDKFMAKDIFSYHRVIDYAFSKHEYKKQISFSHIDNELKKLAGDILTTNILIDTRDITKWHEIKNLFQFYRPTNKKYDLIRILQHQYKIFPVSQAWAKMWEILINTGIVDADSKSLSSFHVCEAPGNFICALKHFVKTQTKISDFEWRAQSLNPYEKKVTDINKNLIGDTYGMIENNPNNWLFGSDNTGDITNPQNINHYVDFFKHKKPDLMTSDCGIAKSEETDKRLLHVVFCQFYTMLKCLKKGGSYVAKVFIPLIHPIELSMIYILYLHFEELRFFKGVVNPNSKEYYIVCKGYMDDVDISLFNKIEKYVISFDSDVNILGEEYSKEFYVQLMDGMEKITNNFIYTIKKQIFLTDNYENIDKDEFFFYIEKKNNDWIKKNKIKNNEKQNGGGIIGEYIIGKSKYIELLKKI